MATTKLTLSMEPEIVNRAKEYAKRRQISLSKLIQDFLEQAIKTEEVNEDEELNIPEDIKSLVGILKGPDISKKQLREMKYEYLKDKYGL